VVRRRDLQLTRRTLVVGSSTRFLSGISYYTWHLAEALSHDREVATLLMRRLIPARLYPGRARIGAPITPLRFNTIGPTFDGVDWYWIPSIVGAVRFLRRQRPDVVVFEWWTAAVGHSYLLLAWLARRSGAAVVIEFHETQDTGEAGLPLVARYGQFVVRRLLGLAAGVVVHSEFDRRLIEEAHGLRGLPVVVAPHGPYSHERIAAPARREAPTDTWNILFFGTIRPYKGLEHLVEAFELLPDDVAAHCWLTVVGETWEGWTLPLELLAASPRRERTTVVNRYVEDDELAAWIAGADIVVLPYLRSSASGPLHTAMSAGLPTVVTAVGGLVEAASDYSGTTFVPAADPGAIAEAIEHLVRHGQRDERHDDPQSWSRTAERYAELIAAIDGRR
jgi:glycosyltransferase involved in cell wall biosynthesis